MLFRSVVDQLHDAVGVLDVGNVSVRPVAGLFFDVGDGFVQVLPERFGRGQHDLRAFPGQFGGDAAADAGGGR